MNQNRFGMQRRKSDISLPAKLQLFLSQEEAGHFTGTAQDEEARHEDAGLQPSVEALIQVVLNSNNTER